MADAIFMQVEGHKSAYAGKDPRHQGWVPVKDVNLGISAAGLMSGSPGPSKSLGQTGVQAISIIKDADTSTAFLFQVCAKGSVIGKVLIDYCEMRNGKVVRRKLRQTLTNVVFARSKRLRGDAGKGSGEEHVLSFASLKFAYNV